MKCIGTRYVGGVCVEHACLEEEELEKQVVCLIAGRPASGVE